MTGPGPVVLVRLSESFATTVHALVTELGLAVSDRAAGETAVPGGLAVLLLAGGEEPQAVELLAGAAAGGVPVYLVGAVSDHRLAAAAIRQGARDYLALPEDIDLLRRTLERLKHEAAGREAAERFAADERATTGFDAIFGRSAALRETLAQAERVARHRDVTVLIGGETGTGKELLARAIHYHGPRAAEPFVEINCAAIPATLLESELFGHEKGAFTGAIAAKPGLFEMAHGGTLFLDEVGEIPLELQPKLLRALESRTIRRIGASQGRTIDVRVIAATHRDLAREASAGRFREDLFYRLNVVALVLPPLRAREGDAELLAERFLEQLSRSYGLTPPPLDAATREAIRRHAWPGNVRELRNAVERALVLSAPGTLDAGLLAAPTALPAEASGGVLPFPATLEQLIDAAAHRMLELTNGNKSEAARRLGISRPRLQRILDGAGDPSTSE
jgi:two-component system response regulator HydG